MPNPKANNAKNTNKGITKRNAKLIRKTARVCLYFATAHTRDGTKNTHREIKLKAVWIIAEVICSDMLHRGLGV